MVHLKMYHVKFKTIFTWIDILVIDPSDIYYRQEEKAMKERSKKEYSLLLCGLILFCILAVICFGYYNRYLKQQFHDLENKRRMASVLWQSQRIRTELAQKEGMLEAVAHMAETANFSPKEKWFQDYLKEMNTAEDYTIEYYPIEWIFSNNREKVLLDYNGCNYSSVLNGERVFSEILYSSKPFGYYFAIGEPVSRNGKTIGVMCCTIPAYELVQQPGNADTIVPDCQFIVDKNGTVLYSYGTYSANGKNILNHIKEKSNISEENAEEIQKSLSDGSSITIALDGSHDQYMMACTYLGYHDWSLVQFIKSGSMRELSNRLMRGTVILCIVFGILTICAAFLIGRSIFIKNKRLKIEYEKQVSLATAFDTLLFEYNPVQDVLIMIPGDNSAYDIQTLKIKNCLKYSFRAIHPEDVPKIKHELETLSISNMELRVLGKDGTWIWCECQLQQLTINGKDSYIVGRVININERKLRELKLLKEVSIDNLTGLLNRYAIQSAVEQRLKDRTAGFLFMCDVDNFKMINDTLGHSVGDALLCKVAELLKSCFTSSDFVGRQSGDEFIAYMNDTGDEEDVRKRAALILERFVKLSQWENITVSISIGVSRFPADADTFEKLYITADTAMYEAKNMGKNRFCFYHEMSSKKMPIRGRWKS